MEKHFRVVRGVAGTHCKLMTVIQRPHTTTEALPQDFRTTSWSFENCGVPRPVTAKLAQVFWRHILTLELANRLNVAFAAALHRLGVNTVGFVDDCWSHIT